jgi:hypothetical protein
MIGRAGKKQEKIGIFYVLESGVKRVMAAFSGRGKSSVA